MRRRSQYRADLGCLFIDKIGRDDPFTLLERQDIQSAAAVSRSDADEAVAAAVPVYNQSGNRFAAKMADHRAVSLGRVYQEIFVWDITADHQDRPPPRMIVLAVVLVPACSTTSTRPVSVEAGLRTNCFVFLISTTNGFRCGLMICPFRLK